MIQEGLRPQRLGEFIGQSLICENLGVYIQSAKKRNESMDHVLFSGPPGLGKTTLARLIGNEIDATVHETSGPVLCRAGDVASILSTLDTHDIIFIDEIHRLPRAVEELLYPAMEDYRLDIMVGKGLNAKSVQIELPSFTLVGATTRMGLLTAPLRERFGISFSLNFYSLDEIKLIMKRYTKPLAISISKEALDQIAKSARGTPRTAIRLLRRVRDFMIRDEIKTLSGDDASRILDAMEVDDRGLDSLDRRYLQVLSKNFSGGPAGLEAISAALSENTETIENVLEPYLIQLGLVQRTSRGRVLNGKLDERRIGL